ncbi:hypothetical protein [Levilactobacillus sp. N40-8-2]|uniref:hypothetical protein n=1 Tax=Levilactobacillus muriae TaxID=3238987 RepID=UPI0038B386F4
MRPFKIDTGYQHFSGIISHYGKDLDGRPVTAIINVEDDSGRLITDHIWVQHWLKPRKGSEEKNIGKIISFTAKPVLYTRHNAQTQDYSLDNFGRIFRAIPLPTELSPKFCKRMRRHQNNYFAGVIHQHQLSFIGQGSDGKITETTENTRFFTGINELISKTSPYLNNHTPVIFKVIIYQGILFLGITR